MRIYSKKYSCMQSEDVHGKEMIREHVILISSHHKNFWFVTIGDVNKCYEWKHKKESNYGKKTVV